MVLSYEHVQERLFSDNMSLRPSRENFNLVSFVVNHCLFACLALYFINVLCFFSHTFVSYRKITPLPVFFCFHSLVQEILLCTLPMGVGGGELGRGLRGHFQNRFNFYLDSVYALF